MNPSAFRAPAVAIVALVLVAETLVLLGLSGFLTYQIAANPPDAIDSAVGLLVITVIATAWIAATTIGFFQGRSFARGSALVWQVLQAAVGLASNQGLFARPDIGSGLFVPALTALALLLFSPSVSKHLGTARDGA
jgi:hypothetical protein